MGGTLQIEESPVADGEGAGGHGIQRRVYLQGVSSRTSGQREISVRKTLERSYNTPA